MYPDNARIIFDGPDLNFEILRNAPKVPVETQCITAENSVLIITIEIQPERESVNEMKYRKFSVMPKPSPIAPPYTIPSVRLSNFLLATVINKNVPFINSSTKGATIIVL